MAQTTKSIEVNVPVRTAYNQWTQFEEFPRFMEGVKAVQQIDDKRLHWIASIGGKTEEWDAEITEQHQDHRIAWTSRSGDANAGVVTFHELSPTTTRVTVQMDYAPEGIVETLGDMVGVVDRRVEGDLERFKAFIESRGTETGGWRGDIENRSDSPGTQRS